MTPPVDREWVQGLPKAEVHCHLEGCVPREIVREAARRQGAIVPQGGAYHPAVSSLAQLLVYLELCCGVLDEPGDLAQVAYGASGIAAASGVRHLDAIVTPIRWVHWRHRVPSMVAAFDSGFADAEADGLTPAKLCLSLDRSQGGDAANELVELMIATAHPRVAALSVDGNERNGSHTTSFVPAFATAAAHGFRRCAHAGESSGPAGVKEAVELLGAERIDHGVRAIEDPRVVAELVRREMPLDVCTTSNERLGVVPDLARHPVEALRRAGVPISLNTDNPLVFGCDVAGEYLRCAEAFEWTRPEVGEIARTSIVSSFATPETRDALVAELEAYLALG